MIEAEGGRPCRGRKAGESEGRATEAGGDSLSVACGEDSARKRPPASEVGDSGEGQDGQRSGRSY